MVDILGALSLGGTGHVRKAWRQHRKIEALKLILQHYFQDTSGYDGSDIEIFDAPKAIKYACHKTEMKQEREAAKATLVATTTGLGSVAGAVAGAVVPAGSIAGGLIGGGTANAAGEVLAFTGEAISRTAKAIWKWGHGTKGRHRQQAALALYFCARMRPDTSYGTASLEALGVILGPNLPKVMAMDEREAIPEIMEHLKSVSWFTW